MLETGHNLGVSDDHYCNPWHIKHPDTFLLNCIDLKHGDSKLLRNVGKSLQI
jgi:hypothetical protein